MNSPIVTEITILNKKFKTIPVIRDIYLDYSHHSRKPRIGDKVVYTSRNGGQGIGYFVGIKEKQETCIIYNMDVVCYNPHDNVLPHFSYMSESHLRLINWSENGLSQNVLDSFSTFLKELYGLQ